jgi:hypothetical protein
MLQKISSIQPMKKQHMNCCDVPSFLPYAAEDTHPLLSLAVNTITVHSRSFSQFHANTFCEQQEKPFVIFPSRNAFILSYPICVISVLPEQRLGIRRQ